MSTDTNQITKPTNEASRYTKKSLLLKNSVWSLLAQGLPLIIALFTVPVMIKGYGVERFGILSIMWIIIGYSSVFDLGLGRALTQMVSKKLGSNDTEDLSQVIWTALAIISIPGIAMALLIFALTPIIVYFLNVPEAYKSETQNSMYLLAVSLPFLIWIISMKGILESYQKFVIISIMRIPVILCNYLAPVILLTFTQRLDLAVLVIVVGRILTCFAYFYANSRVIPDFFTKIDIKTQYIKPLLNFGGWITVSNLTGPLLLYMDRFIIAFALSATVVAYYTTPFDIITKMWIAPTAIMNVIFPALTSEIHNDKKRAKKLYYESLKYIFLIVILPVLFCIIFAKDALTIWIGLDFAEKSYQVCQIIAVGTLINSVKHVSTSLIQASGRSDITGWLSIVQLPIYLFILIIVINRFGLPGVALIWCIRNFITGIVSHIISLRILKDQLPHGNQIKKKVLS